MKLLAWKYELSDASEMNLEWEPEWEKYSVQNSKKG